MNDTEIVDVEYNQKYNAAIRKKHKNFVKELRFLFFTGSVWGVNLILAIISFIIDMYLITIITTIFVVLLFPSSKILNKKIEEKLIKK